MKTGGDKLGLTGMGMGMGQIRGMKVRSSVKKMCEGCKVCFSFLLLGFRFEFGEIVGCEKWIGDWGLGFG